MRLTEVVVGPLATAGDTKLCASQKCPSANALALDGTYASGYSATNIAAAQAVAGAGNLTLTTQATNLGGRSVVIVSAADDTAITFTVKGIGTDGVSYASETVTGSNASRVATRTLFNKVTAISASGAAGGNVSAGTNGLIATMDTPRRVQLKSGGDDSGITFTLYGTDWNGDTLVETIAGANATTTYTTYDFKTVTAIWPSAATADTIQVGTNGVASSRPIFLDAYTFSPTSLQGIKSGTVNYTVQQSLDNPSVSTVTWINHPDTALVGAVANVQGNYAYAPTVTRLLLNSGTGSVTYKVVQNASPT